MRITCYDEDKTTTLVYPEVEQEYKELKEKVKTICPTCLESEIVSQEYGKSMKEKRAIAMCQRKHNKAAKQFLDKFNRYNEEDKIYAIDEYNDFIKETKYDPLCSKYLESKFFKNRPKEVVEVAAKDSFVNSNEGQIKINISSALKAEDPIDDLYLGGELRVAQAICHEYTPTKEERKYCSMALEQYLLGQLSYENYIELIKRIIVAPEMEEVLESLKKTRRAAVTTRSPTPTTTPTISPTPTTVPASDHSS